MRCSDEASASSLLQAKLAFSSRLNYSATLHSAALSFDFNNFPDQVAIVAEVCLSFAAAYSQEVFKSSFEL